MEKADPLWDALESAAPPSGKPILDLVAPAKSLHRQAARRREGWAIASRDKAAIHELRKKLPDCWMEWNAQGCYWWVAKDAEDAIREVFANFDELRAKAPDPKLI